MEIIDFLNKNEGSILGILTFLLVVVTGFYAYTTWKLLKKQEIGMVENTMFRMIENFNNFNTNITHRISEGKTLTTQIEKVLNGLELFKYLSMKFLRLFNNQGAQENIEELKKVVVKIQKEYGSILWQIMNNLDLIYKFIDENFKEEKRKITYKKYIDSQIPLYLKFITTIFFIYLPNDKFNLSSELIKHHEVMNKEKLYQFKNYISEEYFDNFCDLFKNKAIKVL